MERLIDITGYAETYEDLCTVDAMDGEFYNVLEGNPFTTYWKTGNTEIGFLKQMTDIIGWYKNTAELESNVRKPKDGDIYIIGEIAPYTRMKAVVRGVDIRWEEDGEEEKKILQNYKSKNTAKRAVSNPEGDIFYSVGKAAPFELFGKTAAWEPIGSFISVTAKNKNVLNVMSCNRGEVAFTDGTFYIHTGNAWREIPIIEPIENVSKHIYKTKDKYYRLREGRQAGTLEWFEPRS